MSKNKRFTLKYAERNLIFYDNGEEIGCLNVLDLLHLLNDLNDENEELKKDLKESQKLKNKRLRKVRNQRAVLEEIGGVIIGYKSQLQDLHHKIDKIKEAMEDTGALTKRQLEEILK